MTQPQARLAGLILLAATPAHAVPPPTALAPITVVATTPVLGSGVDRDQVPANVQVLGPAEIDRTGIPGLTAALLETIPSATVNETSGNVFQPDILFRGFTASPVAGTAQGLAVYLNGMRFNDPFGDTVNWDLIPPAAIDTVNVQAANPVFGLNALGGSVNVQLKNGFSQPGASLTTYGGSFDRGAGIAEYGHQWGNWAVYGAADVTHDGGYRQTQASDLYRLFTDLGWRNDQAEIHLSVIAADNTLGNPGASPVQELNVASAGIFTGPNQVYNKYVGVNLNAEYALNASTSVQAVAYFQNLTQRVSNGATTDTTSCNDGSLALCNDDGSIATTFGAAPIPDFLNGGAYSALVLEGLDTHAYGASLQTTADTPIADRRNHLVLGASLDGSASVFNAATLIGGFTEDGSQLFVGPPQYTQVQPDEGIQPVKLATVTRNAGLFLSDVLSLTPRLDLTLNGRFNNAEIDLHDKRGTALTGQHAFSRFNPGGGLTYKLTPAVQLYASYAEANRAPTPTELSCASAANPCSLLNFFIGDPNLKQVVARTIEAGLRGQFLGRFGWSADCYRIADTDDLIFQSARDNPNLAFYTNAGRTRRQGLEAQLRYTTNRLHVVLGYAYTDATFRSPLLLGSASNPFADANGNEQVVPGDRIPGIPQHRGTAVANYALTDRWSIGGSAVLASDQVRFGDEANLGKSVGGYAVLNLDTRVRLTRAVTLFGLINNVTNRRYDTYGTFGPVDAVPFPAIPGGVTDPRTATPGQPISVYGGLKIYL